MNNFSKINDNQLINIKTLDLKQNVEYVCIIRNIKRNKYNKDQYFIIGNRNIIINDYDLLNDYDYDDLEKKNDNDLEDIDPIPKPDDEYLEIEFYQLKTLKFINNDNDIFFTFNYNINKDKLYNINIVNQYSNSLINNSNSLFLSEETLLNILYAFFFKIDLGFHLLSYEKIIESCVIKETKSIHFNSNPKLIYPILDMSYINDDLLSNIKKKYNNNLKDSIIINILAFDNIIYFGDFHKEAYEMIDMFRLYKIYELDTFSNNHIVYKHEYIFMRKNSGLAKNNPILKFCPSQYFLKKINYDIILQDCLRNLTNKLQILENIFEKLNNVQLKNLSLNQTIDFFIPSLTEEYLFFLAFFIEQIKNDIYEDEINNFMDHINILNDILKKNGDEIKFNDIIAFNLKDYQKNFKNIYTKCKSIIQQKIYIKKIFNKNELNIYENCVESDDIFLTISFASSLLQYEIDENKEKLANLRKPIEKKEYEIYKKKELLAKLKNLKNNIYLLARLKSIHTQKKSKLEKNINGLEKNINGLETNIKKYMQNILKNNEWEKMENLLNIKKSLETNIEQQLGTNIEQQLGTNIEQLENNIKQMGTDIKELETNIEQQLGTDIKELEKNEQIINLEDIINVNNSIKKLLKKNITFEIYEDLLDKLHKDITHKIDSLNINSLKDFVIFIVKYIQHYSHQESIKCSNQYLIDLFFQLILSQDTNYKNISTSDVDNYILSSGIFRI